MPLDPNIPLAAGAMAPNPVKMVGQAYELAGAMEKQQQVQEQRQDQQSIQQYLKEGGNFNTPEGLAAAAEKLKGIVSPKAYQTLEQARQESKLNEAKVQEQYLKLPEEVLKGEAAQNQSVIQQLDTGVMQHQKDVTEVGQQEADRRYGEYKNQILPQLAQQKMPNGQPLYPPQLLQKYSGSNVKQDQSAMMSMKYKQDQIKSSLENRYKEQQIATERAQEKKYLAQAKGGAGGISEEITNSGATGNELLGMLPPGKASQVKAIAEGRIALESIPARGGTREQLTQLVNQYDPNFSAIATKTKAAVEKDFSSGVASRNISSINTAIGHLGTLNKLGIALKNNDNQTLNRITNAIAGEFGNPDITNYQLAQIALGEELMRTFRGVGASVTEAEQWKNQLGSAKTPQQMLNVVKTASDLLESRISAMDSAYKRGTKSEKGFQDILDPKSVNTLTALTGKDYYKMYNLTGKGRGAGAEEVKQKPSAAGGFSHLWK